MSENNDVIQITTQVKRTRRLKVGSNKSQTDGSLMPRLAVAGIYLKDLGFDVDGYFDMTINQDRTITLTSVSKEQNDAEEAAKKSIKDAAK